MAMTMIFRKAIINDIQILQQINRELQTGTGQEGFLRQTLDFESIIVLGNCQVYVAEQASEILGYMTVLPYFPEERLDFLRNSLSPLIDLTNSSKYHYIKQLAVQKQYQRQGIGSFLYSSLFALFPLHLFLGIVLAENQASLKFQLTQGAKIVAEYWKDNKLAGHLLAKGQSLLPANTIQGDIAI